MRKKIILLIALMTIQTFNSAVAMTPLSDGNFDTTVDVESVPSHILGSGNFDTMVYIEYLAWTNWSGWWSMSTFTYPIISNPNPANGTSGMGFEFTWSVLINSSDANTFNWSINCSNGQSNSSTFDTDGRKNLSISGLSDNTTYTVWVNATNTANATATSHEWYLFSTYPNITKPAVETGEATNIQSTSATLNGNLTEDGGEICDVWFEYGETTSYGSTSSTFQNTAPSSFSYNADSLNRGKLHHFRIVAQNSNGTAYGNDSIFLTKPDSPTYIAVHNNYAPTMLNLSWTKKSDANASYIERNTKASWNRGEGTEVYNGTAEKYTDTGLEQNKKYYYRIWAFSNWSYNGTTLYQFSQYSGLGFNTTKIVDEPYNGNSIYYTGINALNLTWSRGNNSDREIVVMKNDSYPTSPSDGVVKQNSTNTWYNESNVFSGRYYTIWSYNDTAKIYSQEGLNIAWGALGVSVFNESNPSQAITNWNIHIKNRNGSDTYTSYNQNNILYLDMLDIPYGNDIAIKVWRNGYKERIIYTDLFVNNFYNFSFYLPANQVPEGGGEPGSGNQTEPAIYYIRVVETYETSYGTYDKPVEDAMVTFQRYINTTEKYENISSLLTDANGYVNLYLIPSTLYQVVIDKEGYIQKIADYIPAPPNIYGQTEEKIFRITPIENEGNYTPEENVLTNITWSIEPHSTRHTGSFTLWFNITSSDNKLEWYRLLIWYYNDSNSTWILLSSQNESNASGGSLNYTFSDISGKYAIECFYKKQGYAEYECLEQGSLVMFIVHLKESLQNIPNYAYYIVLIVIMILVMGFVMFFFGTGISTGYIGLTIFALGLLLKPVEISLGHGEPISGWLIFAATFIIYTAGIFIWSKI